MELELPSEKKYSEIDYLNNEFIQDIHKKVRVMNINNNIKKTLETLDNLFELVKNENEYTQKIFQIIIDDKFILDTCVGIYAMEESFDFFTEEIPKAYKHIYTDLDTIDFNNVNFKFFLHSSSDRS